MNAEAAAAVVPARLELLKGVFNEVGNGESKGMGSLFEAKSGHAPCVLQTATTIRGKDFDLPTTLAKMLPVKQAVKSLNQHLQSSPWGYQDIASDTKGKKIITTIAKCFDPMVMSKLPVDTEQGFGAKVYRPSFLGLKKYFMHCNLSPYAAMEARLVVEGSEFVMGVQCDDVPPQGDDLKQKRNWMASASAADLKELFGTKGFLVKHDSSNLLIVPSGWMCYIFSEDGAKIIRWGLSSDNNDTSRVKVYLDMMIRSSAELRSAGAGYTAFHRYLNE